MYKGCLRKKKRREEVCVFVYQNVEIAVASVSSQSQRFCSKTSAQENSLIMNIEHRTQIAVTQ
jgi:hypothetical protein